MKAQQFSFSGDRQKAVIPFRLINNLIFIPVTVNGVELNFMLDSGVDKTILFSLDDTDEVSFENIEKIELRGLGHLESISGLKSTGNKLQIGALHDVSHDIYIILDQHFNFSSYVGIPVNGILGYQFFKNLVVKIDYNRKKLTVYSNSDRLKKQLNRYYDEVPMSIEHNKPYVGAMINRGRDLPVKLLIDSGSSDALWLFPDKDIQVPEKHFDDYLGLGFSGEIFGKRGRIANLQLADFTMLSPIVSFPDSVSLRNLTKVDQRSGSVGGEILRRFTVVFDYPNKLMYLRKGKHFNEPFDYNMSGMEIYHTGVQWVQETVPLQTVISESSYDVRGDKISDFRYKFELKPTYAIAGIRTQSPAAESGLLKGDVLVRINKKAAYQYTLQEINELLKSTEGRKIQLLVQRDGKFFEKVFYLKKIL